MGLLLRGLLVVAVSCSAGCGGLRHTMGEEEYLRQRLYDYAYIVPLDTLWEEAKLLAESVRDESRTEDGVRTAVVSLRRGLRGDETSLDELFMRGWEEGGRSYVKFFAVGHGLAAHPYDIGVREVNAELDLLARFAPADAARFREGARRAGQRAR
ncbi:hypothetical protein [Myxococcus sp. SDU36]|uniref:hypothetical protein n=1 Tax=Myxococcus sp. SDU36 TaxID=2831967 RepID=UPI002543CA20|nr:hypothetical protein [Myxococcus sp. SDU36]WIG98724.1 hypothetical protein KGD87_15775 [Myxococcus sp. SDU36]